MIKLCAVGILISDALDDKGMSAKKLSEEIGVSKQYLNYIMSGQFFFSDKKHAALVKLCEILNIKEETLIKIRKLRKVSYKKRENVVSDFINKIRALHGINAEKLAKLSKTSVGTVSLIERGIFPKDKSIVERIISVLQDFENKKIEKELFNYP